MTQFVWVGLLASSPVLVVHAQTTTASTSSENSVSTLSPAEQERIINLAANVSNKIEAATTRLYGIIDRMESRAQKMTAVPEHAQTAQSVIGVLEGERMQLLRVAEALEGIDQRVYEMATAPDPKTYWEYEAGWYLREAQSVLKEVYGRMVLHMMRLKDPTAVLPQQTASSTVDSDQPASSTPQTATSTASTTNKTSS